MSGTNAPHLAVVGAGPAGLGAAIAARMANLDVIVIDDQLEPGGQIWRSAGSASLEHAKSLGEDYRIGRERVQQFLNSGAEHLAEHTVWQVEIEDDRPILYCAGPKGTRVIRPEQVLVATGAVERPFPIPGWTLPGVMTAGALQILLKSARLCSDSAVLAGTGPLLWLLASQMIEAGFPPLAIVETVAAPSYLAAAKYLPVALNNPAPLLKGIGLMSRVFRAGVPVYRGASNLRIDGDLRARALMFENWRGATTRIEAETIGLHCGVVPNQQVSRLLRLPHVWDAKQRSFAPERDLELKAAPRLFIAGDGAGIAGADAAWIEGQMVGNIAAGLDVSKLSQRLATLKSGRNFLDRLYLPPKQLRRPANETVVCRCENVTAGRIREAVRDSAAGPNQVKFMLRAGMGPCQGRVCGLAVSEIVADTLGKDMDRPGYFRIRPPLKPLPLSMIAIALCGQADNGRSNGENIGCATGSEEEHVDV